MSIFTQAEHEEFFTEPGPAVRQLAISHVGRVRWDVIVVGAGPTGGSAAALLAAHDLSVLLVDRARFPRDKVCGDGLVPEAMQALDRIGLGKEVRSRALVLPGYTMVSPCGASVTVDTKITTLQRRTLDALIAGKAVSNGAVFAQAQFLGAHRRPDGDMECSLDNQTLQCRVLIIAPGADLSSLRTLGMTAASKPEGVAIRRYYRSSRGPQRPYFFLNEAFLPGYAWIFPLGNSYYNVGCGRFLPMGRKHGPSLGIAFEDFLQKDPVARELVSHAEMSTPLCGASLRCGMRTTASAYRDRVLLAGEAIGTTIPGWGEGISNALETGLLAADVTIAAFRENDFTRLQDYPRRLAAEIKPAIAWHAHITLFFNRKWTANLLVALARPLLAAKRLLP